MSWPISYRASLGGDIPSQGKLAGRPWLPSTYPCELVYSSILMVSFLIILTMLAVFSPAASRLRIQLQNRQGADFMVSFERDQLAALDRFFAHFDSPHEFSIPSSSAELPSRALEFMPADIRKACVDIGLYASGCMVRLSLDDDEAHAASDALKKLKMRALEWTLATSWLRQIHRSKYGKCWT